MLPNPLHQAHQNFFVRGYDQKSQRFTLSPADGSDRVVTVGIAKDNSGRSRIKDQLIKAAFSARQGRDQVKLVLARRPLLDESKEVIGEELVVDEVMPSGFTGTKAREIRAPADDGERKQGDLITTWTEGLDEALGRYHDISTYRAALDFHKKLLEDPAAFTAIRTRAGGILQAEVDRNRQSFGDTKIPADLSVYLNTSYTEGVRGMETDNQGKLRSRRYNTLEPFNAQSEVTNTQHSLTRLGNYALQKAFVEAFGDVCVAVEKEEDGRAVSLIEAQQQDLLDDNILLCGHPNKGGDEFVAESREAGRVIGSLALAGLMDMRGAKPVSRDFDELVVPDATGGYLNASAVHTQSMREITGKLDGLAQDESVQAYLYVASDVASRYEHSAQLTLHQKQVDAAGKVRAPTPPKARRDAEPPGSLKRDPAHVPLDLKEQALQAGQTVAHGIDKAMHAHAHFPVV